MNTNNQTYDRREFLKWMGATGTAVLTLNALPTFGATPKRGGTLHVGTSFLMQTTDPHRYTGFYARQAFALAWEGLLAPTSLAERYRLLEEHGPDAAIPQVKPMLAHSWETDKNGSRYVFHLKKGVRFHNGKEFDSEDVKWSWLRIKDPIYQSGTRKFLTLFLDSVETPDKHTVVANLSQPYGAFLMANTWCYTIMLPKDAIPPKTIWGETPTFKPTTPAPPGTGPFRITKFQQNYQAVYERFENYRIKDLPYLDKVIFKVITQDGPRTMALRAGNIDCAYRVDEAWLATKIKGKPINTPHHLKDEKLILWPAIFPVNYTIFLNSHPEKDTPFKDERVRQALAYCIDQEAIAKALYGELGIPMNQGYNPDISPWGYRDIKGRKRDIPKARALLKEAGYPTGLDVDFLVNPVYGRNDLRAQIIQQMAKPAGFRLKIMTQIGVQVSARLRTYAYQMMTGAIGGEDPMNFYYNQLRTDPAPPSNGYSPRFGLKDSEMDRLLDLVANEPDHQQRKAIFKKAVQRSIDKAYIIPNNQAITAFTWSDKLQNFHPWNYYQAEQAFAETWIEDG
ncbi:MAG: ABC transporter substrate-binding protein [bacterium]|nr:ABC transporter substrate-binding protein [bacterium]